jgi:hypothetical protein
MPDLFVGAAAWAFPRIKKIRETPANMASRGTYDVRDSGVPRVVAANVDHTPPAVSGRSASRLLDMPRQPMTISIPAVQIND